jgi:hypothetical protein
MSASLSAFFTRKNIRRVGLVAMPLVALSFLAPGALADGWKREGDNRGRNSDWRHRDNDWRGDWRNDSRRDHDDRRGGTQIVIRPEIVIGSRRPDVVVVERRRERRDVAPCEIRFKAYQSEDRVILNVEGENRSGGFTTSLSSCHDGTITLTNLEPYDCSTQCITPFCLTGSIGARHCLHSLRVNVAGRTYTVPVIQAQSL